LTDYFGKHILNSSFRGNHHAVDSNRSFRWSWRYWVNKLRSARYVENVSIRNLIIRQDGEADWLAAVLVIDDSPADESSPEYLDLNQLRISLHSAGRFFPWTCSCGVPGCAGMFLGVYVSHHSNKTTWLDLDLNRKLVFSTTMLRSAFNDAIIEGAEILALDSQLEITPDQNSSEYKINSVETISKI
tara:strand:- start:335 stop:895 length:561 start_codon:yes stop_codon:yes gene_type:complete